MAAGHGRGARESVVRTLILVLSAVVIALSILILLDRPLPARSGTVFEISRLIADARAGETATYRDESGETLTFRVELAVPGGVDRVPRIRVWSLHYDRSGRPMPGGGAVYDHLPTRHGIFPLTAPGDPEGYDRLWVWDRIRRSPVAWQGGTREVWRVDLTDPALPEQDGGDHVVAWISESIPVFGLIRWQRQGRTWDLVDWRPK